MHEAQTLPPFPPKKMFSLSKSQLEERRYRLEKYLQSRKIPFLLEFPPMKEKLTLNMCNLNISVSQNNEIINSPVLRRFLFLAQQKCMSTWHSESELTVWLLNGTQIPLKVSFEDSSENVLQV